MKKDLYSTKQLDKLKYKKTAEFNSVLDTNY